MTSTEARSQIGGKGAFTRRADEHLLDGRVEATIACAKDTPGPHDRAPGITIGAVLPREDVRDVLVLPAGRPPVNLDALPPGTHVGTSAPRPAALLKALHPQIVPVPIFRRMESPGRRALPYLFWSKGTRSTCGWPCCGVVCGAGERAVGWSIWKSESSWHRGVVWSRTRFRAASRSPKLIAPESALNSRPDPVAGPVRRGPRCRWASVACCYEAGRLLQDGARSRVVDERRPVVVVGRALGYWVDYWAQDQGAGGDNRPRRGPGAHAPCTR
ncbi:hypothetical protein [Streptomyces fimbriatus]|uniref:hydroxymethylbilane synthase n=1 Tax=Streptomyces fimbriatus TaxID=68197 RepID=A0ABW0DG72_STRFI